MLWHIGLNIYIWKTDFTSHKQYLLGLSFSRNAKKTQTGQAIPQAFLVCLKRNVSQTFKSSSCKKIVSKCLYHWYNLLRWTFFIPSDNWKTFFTQAYCHPEVWYNRHVPVFFVTSVLKEIRILCPLSPQ